MSRKYLYFVLTLLFHFITIDAISSVFDNTALLLVIFFTVLLSGAFMLIHPTIANPEVRKIGWGMLYGSILIMLVGFGFLLLFAFNFFNIT